MNNMNIDIEYKVRQISHPGMGCHPKLFFLCLVHF